MNSTVAAVVVTHNAQEWIRETITSILLQSKPPIALIVIDDRSTDDTLHHIREVWGDSLIPLMIHPATSESTVTITRIAMNFIQGVQVATDIEADLVALGDHDDIWCLDRVLHQSALLDETSTALMVASDGSILGGAGSLREVFPVPLNWLRVNARDQLRYALRHSIATGGASMIRPRAYTRGLVIPDGWLHDRWWSLVAVAREGMLIDRGLVIEYRVQEGQQVGLDTGNQQRAPRLRIFRALARPTETLGKIRDLHKHLRPQATTKGLKAELRWGALLGTLVRGKRAGIAEGV